MATAGSWTTHDLIQKWFIWLNCIHRKLYSLMKLTKKYINSLLLVVMIILITHVFLRAVVYNLAGNAFTISTC